MNGKKVVALVMLICLPLLAWAQDDKGMTKLRAELQKSLAQYAITNIEKTEMPGMFAVQINGSDWIYASEDGQFVFSGNMFAVRDGKLLDLTEQKQVKMRRDALAAVPLKDMVIFSPAKQTKAVIYAFTDVDCGYCKRFHQEVPRLNELGIEVRYLAWPRSGLGESSVTYKKMQSVWCAKDPKDALTRSKMDQKISPASEGCKTAIPEQYKLGLKLGVRGTPALYLEDGTQVGGYRSADELAQLLGLLPQNK